MTVKIDLRESILESFRKWGKQPFLALERRLSSEFTLEEIYKGTSKLFGSGHLKMTGKLIELMGTDEVRILNLYILTTSEKLSLFDIFDSVLVCAVSAEEARKIDPRKAKRNPNCLGDMGPHSWTNDPSSVTATLIGVAQDSVEPGVVISSFNAA